MPTLPPSSSAATAAPRTGFDRYDKLAIIGQGAYGQVFKVRSTASTSTSSPLRVP
jgi:hypothetical protein